MSSLATGLKICVLENTREENTVEFSIYNPDHTYDYVLVNKATAVKQIRELSKKNYDLFINLCDGGWDTDCAGIEVITALERFNLPFTGANSACYEPSKEHMKMIALMNGVDTPAFVFAYDEDDIAKAAQNLNFPLIVKHFNGASSIGMTKDSRVENPEQLRVQALRFIEEYGGALVEEFIEGREFTVLVTENPLDEDDPLTFTPVECRFGEGETFKHYDLKWTDYEKISWFPVDPAAPLTTKLKHATQRVFVGLRAVGYGRCDFRVDSTGRVYFLELNPNCGIFYPLDEYGSADFILKNDPIGHRGFLDHIMKCALARSKKLSKKFQVGFSRQSGYVWYANQDLREGEVISNYEEGNHFVVSKTHVDTAWSTAQRDFFNKNAHQVSEQIYLMWSTPNGSSVDWSPCSHSDEQVNARYVGLKVVASRNINKGEAIIMASTARQ